jgi:hypothetical protein
MGLELIEACALRFDFGNHPALKHGMLKITVIDSGRQKTARVRVEGRLAGEWVNELRRTSAELGRSILDLEDVSFADSEGVQLLMDLRSSGTRFVNCSPFLSTQLGLARKESTSC